MQRVEHDHQQVGFATTWTKAHPGSGCGRTACDDCPLTPRTLFVVHSELAWIADLVQDDFLAVRLGGRPVTETVLDGLPAAALRWAAVQPAWIRRFRAAVIRYVDRVERPGRRIDPICLAEELALHMALEAGRAQDDPDALLPPDVAGALPPRPGDYAWRRVSEHIGSSDRFRQLLAHRDDVHVDPDDPLHPEAWFRRR